VTDPTIAVVDIDGTHIDSNYQQGKGADALLEAAGGSPPRHLEELLAELADP
jgi:hypothetical protein